MSIKSSAIVYERKFPGPAGLIPKQKISKGTFIVEAKFYQDFSNKDQICSHPTSITCENEPWKEFLRDIGNSCYKMVNILDSLNINSIKRAISACRNKPCKIPILAAVISHIEYSIDNPSIIMKDPSGEIYGVLHGDMWEKFNNILHIGSVLFLRDIGILNLNNSRKSYLNITDSNVISIYSSCGDGKVKITKVGLYPSNEDILVMEAKWDAIVLNVDSPGPNTENSILKFNSPDSSLFPTTPNSSLRNNQDQIFSAILNENNENLNLPKVSKQISKFIPKTVRFNNPKENCSRLIDQNTIEKMNRSSENSQDVISDFFHEFDEDSLFGDHFSSFNKSGTTNNLQCSKENANQSRENDISIISSVLDGIDAESLFGEF